MKYVYLFGPEITEGDANQTDVLGGKGANLAEMSNLNIPVPPGFTISSLVCNLFLKKKKFDQKIITKIEQALQIIEKKINKKLGDTKNPLLLSVRSGAKISMPGMMETVLNIGLTSQTIPILIKKTKNEKFVYDSYRRLMMMYSDVVMDKTNIEESNPSFRLFLNKILFDLKRKNKLKNDLVI